MSRVVYDSSAYYNEKAKLPKANGAQCIICGDKFDKPDKRRSYCSQECFSKWFYSLAIDSWSRIRDEVLKRDGECVKCGVKIGTKQEQFNKNNISLIKFYSSTVVFEVHHVKPIYEGGDEFNPDNCITLCYDCHKEMHTIVGKQKRKNRSLEEFVTLSSWVQG